MRKFVFYMFFFSGKALCLCDSYQPLRLQPTISRAKFLHIDILEIEIEKFVSTIKSTKNFHDFVPRPLYYPGETLAMTTLK